MTARKPLENLQKPIPFSGLFWELFSEGFLKVIWGALGWSWAVLAESWAALGVPEGPNDCQKTFRKPSETDPVFGSILGTVF